MFRPSFIEFAIDKSGIFHIFQVRPITVDHGQFEIKKNTMHNLKNISYNS